MSSTKRGLGGGLNNLFGADVTDLSAAGAADGAALLRQNALAAVLLAGGSVGGNLLLTWLAGRVDASYLFPLVQGSIIVGVTLCSVLLFREKLSARGRLGILLGVAAIAVINL